MKTYDIDSAEGMATQTQAYEAQDASSQATATTVRSQSGTAAALTAETRANRATTTGSLANDLFFETDTTWLYRWTGTAWAWIEGVYMATEATRAALTISTADNGAIFFATDTLILWQVAAGAWAKRLEIKGTANQISASIAAGVLTLALVASPDVTTSYKVAGNKVVGARGAAVADPIGGAVIDVEARVAIVALLGRFRLTGGHGLIAD